MTRGFFWLSTNLPWKCISNMEHGSYHEVVSDDYYLIAIEYYCKLENHNFCNLKKAHLSAAFFKLPSGCKI